MLESDMSDFRESLRVALVVGGGVVCSASLLPPFPSLFNDGLFLPFPVILILWLVVQHLHSLTRCFDNL